MKLRSLLGTGLTALVVLLVLAMILGQALGQPIALGFVETGSMAPTLEPGDGFVALPPSVTGEVEEGDVVTFDARELQGGGLTTHRIVDETEEGYITAGDANPFLDQDGDEPPVQDTQIVAVALQINGEVVRIPQIGTVALAIQGVLGGVADVVGAIPGLSGVADGDIGTMMVAGGILLLLYSAVADVLGNSRQREGRSRARKGQLSAVLILLVLILLITVPATASMVIPAGINELTIIAATSPSESPDVIEVGESAEYEYEISNDGYLPRLTMIEPASPGVEVTQEQIVVWPGETGETTAIVHAPDETGAYFRGISERQYIVLLPTSLLVALHTVHPFLAIAAVNAVIISIVTIVFVVAVGMRPLRMRSEGRDVTLVDKAKRTVRKWL